MKPGNDWSVCKPIPCSGNLLVGNSIYNLPFVIIIGKTDMLLSDGMIRTATGLTVCLEGFVGVEIENQQLSLPVLTLKGETIALPIRWQTGNDCLGVTT